MGKRELVVLLCLSSWCPHNCCVALPHDALGLSVFVIVVFPNHTDFYLLLFDQCVQLVELSCFLYVFLLVIRAVYNVFVLYKKQYSKLFEAIVISMNIYF